MTINLIAIGKLKEDYLRKACDEYIKRLSGYCNFEIHEINEYRLGDNPSQKEIENALQKESENIKKYTKGYIIPMCIEGKQISSPELSNIIQNAVLSGNSTITFIIGSSFGLAQDIKSMGNFRLSMSEMTFPHQLARVMILEQIYRSFQISSGGKYHK